jgi:hypothetical protein
MNSNEPQRLRGQREREERVSTFLEKGYVFKNTDYL